MRAVGVRLKSGTEIFGKCVVSNATRWDTFGRLIPFVPENEAKFRKRYVKSPSFITLHLGIKAGILPVRSLLQRGV
jgi:prolycopene isomerase